MRRYLVPVIFAGFVCTVSAAAAIAADLSKGGDAGVNDYSAYGARIEPIIIYDDQPGVIGRSYWYAPWANRHYFPKTGRRPGVGRLERISAHHASKAENYFRRWTVSSGFPIYVPPTRASQFGIPPVQPTQ
jgi:hypothetical protein